MMFNEKLIQSVKKFPILYDTEHPDYKNVKKKDQIWASIGSKLGHEGTSLKTKWRNIRDCYTKHLKTATSTSTKSASRYKIWQWAPQMEHFRPYMNVVQTESKQIYTEDQSSFFQTGDTKKEITKEDDRREEPENATGFVKVEEESVMWGNHLENQFEAKRRRREESREDVPSIAKVISYLEQKLCTESSLNCDSVDLLFLGLAKSVKTFSPRRQALTKLKIANLVLEQEVEQREEEENF